MPLTTAMSAAATKKGVGNIVDDIYKLGKGKIDEWLKISKINRKKNSLYKKMRNVRNVKTIWQVEKEIDLMSFYTPARVLINDSRRTLNDLSDFGYDGNLIVEGTVGMGKSMLLRYLTACELTKGDAIPLFIEFRRIASGSTLLEHILAEFENLGLEMDERIFSFLAEKGKVILFLDAFDEAPEEQRSALITEIEEFAKRFESMRILMSSRPNSGIDRSPFFRVFALLKASNVL